MEQDLKPNYTLFQIKLTFLTIPRLRLNHQKTFFFFDGLKSIFEMNKRKRKLEEAALPPEQREGDTTVVVSLASHVRNKDVEEMVAIGNEAWDRVVCFCGDDMAYFRVYEF